MFLTGVILATIIIDGGSNLRWAGRADLLDVDELRYYCDEDVALLNPHAAGTACHTGERSCFYRILEAATAG